MTTEVPAELPDEATGLETQIDAWRGYLQKRAALAHADIDELEDHLRGQIDTLRAAGLDDDEAFLVAVRRIGALDDISREFAREHSDRLWKQLVLTSSDGASGDAWLSVESFVVIGLALLAAIAVKLPELFGFHILDGDVLYARNAALFVLPGLTAYFLWKRNAALPLAVAIAIAFVVAGLFANVYPFEDEAHTEVLTALHLPIALWLVVGLAYAGGRWRDHALRMDFVRFTGELVIYYTLIAIGGGVLTAITAGLFEAIDVDPEPIVAGWIIPCGAAGALLVAAWLVEAKQSVVENMAPVLTRLFTPLFVATLLAFLVTMLWNGERIDRDVLIVFDLLLVVVVGLLLYSISARDADRPPDLFDWLNVALIASALLVDTVALAAILGRITDFGFTPNRTAALGENLLLLAHLAGSAVFYWRFLRGSSTFRPIERWQTAYLPLYAAWAAAIVVLFPPLFGFD